MNNELEKFIGDTDRRITALERLLAKRDEAVTELSRTIGDLVSQYQQQGRTIEALKAELRARPIMPAVAVKPGVVDKHAIVGRIETFDSPDGVGAVREERQPIVSHAAPVPTYCPTLAEKKKLLDIVRAKHPKLGSVAIEDFSSCVDFVTSCGRSDTLNTEHYPSYWLDEVSRFTHNWNVTLFGFIAACAALDVPHSDFSRAPYDLGFGLQRYGRQVVGEGWRRLLQGEPVRDPLPGPKLDHSIGIVKEIRAY